jgi:hypothetical protein
VTSAKVYFKSLCGTLSWNMDATMTTLILRFEYCWKVKNSGCPKANRPDNDDF